MKDFYIGSEKMTRNGLKVAISYFCDIWIETDYIYSLICASLIRNSKFSTKLTVQAVGGKKSKCFTYCAIVRTGTTELFFQWFAEKRDSVNPFNSKLLLNLKQTGRYIYPSHNSKVYVRVILKRDMYLITHGERML